MPHDLLHDRGDEFGHIVYHILNSEIFGDIVPKGENESSR